MLDYFAAAALPVVYKEFWGDVRNGVVPADEAWRQGIAMEAYDIAEEMLRVRDWRSKEKMK